LRIFLKEVIVFKNVCKTNAEKKCYAKFGRGKGWRGKGCACEKKIKVSLSLTQGRVS